MKTYTGCTWGKDRHAGNIRKCVDCELKDENPECSNFIELKGAVRFIEHK